MLSGKKIIILFLGLAVFFILTDRSLWDFKIKLLQILPSFSTDNSLKDKIKDLQLENEGLKVQILNQVLNTNQKIKVYSTYPFNNREEIAISAGSNKNIGEGDLVTTHNNLLVGKVIRVLDETSFAQTIFDPNWKMAVRVGDKETDALLNGGNEITLTFIPKDSGIKPGDLIISAGRDFIYGLGVGQVKVVEESSTTSFQTATVEPAFNLNELRDVEIRKIPR